MRKEYLRVEELGLTRLSNAEFINFVRRFLTLLPLEKEAEGDNMAAPKVGITSEQIAEAEKYLEMMSGRNRETRVSQATKSKNETDRHRAALWAAMIQRIITSRKVPIQAEREAAEKIYAVVSPYIGMNNLPNNQQTEVVKSLLADLEKPENLELIRTLGLESYMDQLADTNQAYESLVKDADMQRAILVVGSKMEDMRKQMANLYREMIDYAFATNLLKESEESLLFISGLNGLIRDVKTSYNLRDKSKGDQNKEEGKTDEEGGLEFVPVDKTE